MYSSHNALIFDFTDLFKDFSESVDGSWWADKVYGHIHTTFTDVLCSLQNVLLVNCKKHNALIKTEPYIRIS